MTVRIIYTLIAFALLVSTNSVAVEIGNSKHENSEPQSTINEQQESREERNKKLLAQAIEQVNALRREQDKQIESALRDTSALESKNASGRTALHTAVQRMDLLSVVALLKKGADVNARANGALTPLHLATVGAGIGANKTTPSKESKRLSRYLTETLLDAGANPNVQDAKGRTPLHFAAWNVNLEVIQLLIEAGAILIKSKNGSTPLDYSQKRKAEENNQGVKVENQRILMILEKLGR